MARLFEYKRSGIHQNSKENLCYASICTKRIYCPSCLLRGRHCTHTRPMPFTFACYFGIMYIIICEHIDNFGALRPVTFSLLVSSCEYARRVTRVHTRTRTHTLTLAPFSIHIIIILWQSQLDTLHRRVYDIVTLWHWKGGIKFQEIHILSELENTFYE